MAPAGTVRRLEERALHALPALESERFDGWILQAAGGYTGRANSAAPLDPGELKTADKISYTEDWYRSRGLAPMIRLTPASEPLGLDLVLEQRGYVMRDEGVSVQARFLDRSLSPHRTVEIFENLVPQSWLSILASFQPRVQKHYDSVNHLFSRLPLTSAFAAIHREGEPAAIGRAVFEDGDVGLFDVMTRPDLAGQGLATEITAALLDWGVQHGATRAYLQVVPSNQPAMRLYQKLGFEEVYQYWYRVAPS